MQNKTEVYTLDNGLRVVLENIPHRNSASVGIWLPIGSRLESESEMGYSHFAEHMLFKGTNLRSYKDISREIDRLGGYINASTGKEITNYYVTLSAKFLETGLDILSDMFFNSVFAREDFDVEKKVILEEIKMGEDNPDEYLFDLFYLDSFGDTPIGRPIAGTLQSINDSTRRGLRSFYHDKYGTEGAVVSLAGMLYNSGSEEKELKQKIEKYFGQPPRLLKGRPSLQQITSPEPVQKKTAHYEKKIEQVHFALGLPGLPVSRDGSATFLQVFNHLMGGSMSSRLFRKLREEHGLCYSVGTFHAQYFKEGLFTVYCGTSKESFQQAVDLTLQELKQALKDPPPRLEIDESKSGISGSMELAMESSMRRASFNAKALLYHGEPVDWREDIAHIEKADSDEIWQNLQNLWKDQGYTLTSLGDWPAGQIEEHLKQNYPETLIEA